MTISRENQLGRIQGMLEAFAFFSGAANEGYSFFFDSLDGTGELCERVRGFLSVTTDVENDSLALTPVEKTEIHQALTDWLFKFPNHSLSQDEQSAHRVTSDLLESMIDLASPLAMYRVRFQPRTWYEAGWDDFVLEGDKSCYFLHLGVSD